MTPAPLAEFGDYLDTHGYLDLAELAAECATTPEHVLELERAQCIPGVSYIVRTDESATSSFGTYQLPQNETRLYHPSIATWLSEALRHETTSDSILDVARRVRADFDATFDAALAGDDAPWDEGADYAWAYIVDGTWGLCLKKLDMAHLLTKERARGVIRGAMQRASWTETDREIVRSALEAFESVALPFAPHEVSDSCRHHEIDPARARLERVDATTPR